MIAPVREQVPGFPEALPAGERLLWHGRPDRRALARHVFHWRGVAWYFAALVVLRLVLAAGDAPTIGALLSSAGLVAALGAVAVGVSWLLAALTARGTVYAVTDRRVAMRTGIVVPMFFNIPLRYVDNVAMRSYADGSGELALTIGAPEVRLAWLHLWPHARPWRVARPEPMLRGLPQSERVGELLAEALRATPPAAPAAAPASVLATA